MILQMQIWTGSLQQWFHHCGEGFWSNRPVSLSVSTLSFLNKTEDDYRPLSSTRAEAKCVFNSSSTPWKIPSFVTVCGTWKRYPSSESLREKSCAAKEREQGWRGKGGKKLSSDYNYGTWHLADFKSGRPNFTKAVNGGSELARSLPNQKFALYNFTQSDFSTVIQCNQVIRGEH